jgi:hypothetical protein
MKAQVKITPKVFVEATGDSHVALFEQLASMQEVFGTFNKCGKCDSDELRFVVRTDAEDNKYYELHCQKCFARLAFGANKGDKLGCLYPRRKENKKQSVMGGKLEAGAWLPDNGWLKWNKDKQESE